MPEIPVEARNPRSAIIRTAAAIGVAIAVMLGAFLLLEAARPDGGTIGFVFLLMLPAFVSAFVTYVADPWRIRSLGQYFRITGVLLIVVIVASIPVLKEGTICVVILSPLWLASGCTGAYLTYKTRHWQRNDRSYCVTLLALPLAAMQVEPYVPLPVATATVERSILVDAAPATIWPMLRGIPDVRPGEGRWTITQDVIGVPRPIGARLVGSGIGAERHAAWGHGIRFRERITEWQDQRRIGWRFIFDDMNGWNYTDRHLLPDSPHFTITRGGYRMQPLPDGRTRVTLDTSYAIRTPVNLYAKLWGQLFLGDLENNLLAIIKHRAERAAGPARLASTTQPR